MYPEVEGRIEKIHKDPELPKFVPSTLDQMKYWPKLHVNADLVTNIGPFSKSYEPSNSQKLLSYFHSPLEFMIPITRGVPWLEIE